MSACMRFKPGVKRNNESNPIPIISPGRTKAHSR